MTPAEFITKWRASELKERSAAQEHFIDLCRLLGEPTPAEADPKGERYCFERGARKDTGGDGWADVWKRHHFAWEYKGKRANLDAAFRQLRQYTLALENPPLLIVSDMARFRIHTNWTNSVSKTHEFTLDDLADAAIRDQLKWAMADPERLRPGETRQALGSTCYFTARGFLKALGRRPGKSGLDWLESVFSRLSATDVQIRYEGRTYFGSLIEEGMREEETGRYVVVINPQLARFFGPGRWTQIDWEQRQGLRGKSLALWLHGFYATHAAPHALTVEYLHKLSGSQTKQLKHFKQNLT